VTLWYDNGNKEKEGIIRNNEPEGLWTYYNLDGTQDFNFDYGDGLERVRIADLEERDDIFYKIGKHKPYVGVVIESGGIKKYLLLGRSLPGNKMVNGYNGTPTVRKKYKDYITRGKTWRVDTLV
jgi:antitoxin component YwqK of YwqJK toxin-antitoxin module